MKKLLLCLLIAAVAVYCVEASTCGPRNNGYSCKHLYGGDDCCSVHGYCGKSYAHCGGHNCLSGPCWNKHATKRQLDDLWKNLHHLNAYTNNLHSGSWGHITNVNNRETAHYNAANQHTTNVNNRITHLYNVMIGHTNNVNARLTRVHEDINKRYDYQRRRIAWMKGKIYKNNAAQNARLRSYVYWHNYARKMLARKIYAQEAKNQAYQKWLSDKVRGEVNSKIDQAVSDLNKKLSKEQIRHLGIISKLSGVVSEVDAKGDKEIEARIAGDEKLDDMLKDHSQDVKIYFNDITRNHDILKERTAAEIDARRQWERTQAVYEERREKQRLRANQVAYRIAQQKANEEHFKKINRDMDVEKMQSWSKTLDEHNVALGLPASTSFSPAK